MLRSERTTHNPEVRMSTIQETATQPLSKVNRLELAYREIRELCTRVDLMGTVPIDGRALTPSEQHENARKSQELVHLRLAIITKYGLEEHFLEPLRERAARLIHDLEHTKHQIAALESALENRTTA
jgi:hypothetical protein